MAFWSVLTGLYVLYVLEIRFGGTSFLILNEMLTF